MTVKYTIDCEGSEILVREVDGATYQLCIRASTNPLGNGNILETYSEFYRAVRAADHFCETYAKAKENGFYLQETFLVKPDKHPIPVSKILNEEMQREQVNALFA
ncbi:MULTISPECIES: hypothetical protein [Paenibacillus]|uniref:hypothetical protein n=1 Tax=Paenibacillus TaxID=44249 RepID=UPI00020D66F0|nr:MULTISPECIES: hypothetical protein [Paenibacillus]EGL16046.1 hypothetical protein HMPREF9413_0111 [Paenibacillus sp. HGF7]EPD80856.1 hypothetical protein HMPREF1207_04613 [Paenibacillus sp. HGH0039]MBV6714722.1 hypothetical protein [Paenibacillus chitinolyticus]